LPAFDTAVRPSLKTKTRLQATQRLPPQRVAPAAVQSASVLQSVAAALSQVSQWHLRPAKPLARQSGLATVSVAVLVPVVFDRSSVEAAVTNLSFVAKASNDWMPAVSELLISNVRSSPLPWTL
jgi:hypothetical protein